MGFVCGNWFYRGVLAAASYYLCCVPCYEASSKRRRRKEVAAMVGQEYYDDDGQPMSPISYRATLAFEIDSMWAEQIVRGPGPPKGFKLDPVLKEFEKKFGPGSAQDMERREKYADEMCQRRKARAAQGEEEGSESSRQGAKRRRLESPEQPHSPSKPHTVGLPAGVYCHRKAVSAGSQTSAQTSHSTRTYPSDSGIGISVTSDCENNVKVTSVDDSSAGSNVLNDQMNHEEKVFPASDPKSTGMLPTPPSPVLTKRRHATSVGATWGPAGLTREDEVLSGFDEEFMRLWRQGPSQRSHMNHDGIFRLRPLGQENIWTEGKIPQVNDLHPPIVSRLPKTRAEAQWMLLPPPSADVMAGRTRPRAAPELRWPLAIVENGTAAPEVEAVDFSDSRSRKAQTPALN